MAAVMAAVSGCCRTTSDIEKYVSVDQLLPEVVELLYIDVLDKG